MSCAHDANHTRPGAFVIDSHLLLIKDALNIVLVVCERLQERMAIDDVWRAISVSATIVIFRVDLWTHREGTGERNGEESKSPC